MKSSSIIGILMALALGGGLVLALPDGDDVKAGACAANASGACSKGEALVTAKEGASCGAKTAATPISICEKKAVAIAASLRSESCPKKSLASLSATFPEIRCEKSREKLLADVKAKGSDQEAGQLILAAVKALPTSAKEGEAAGAGNGAVATTTGGACCGAGGCGGGGCGGGGCGGGGCGGGGCGAKAAAGTTQTAAPASKGCCGAKAGAETAAAGKGAGAGDGQKLAAADGQGGKCGGLCAAKAHRVAAKVRSTACPNKSAEILAQALPAITCKDALAKLTAAVKATDCDVDGGDVILAAAASAKPVAEAKK